MSRLGRGAAGRRIVLGLGVLLLACPTRTAAQVTDEQLRQRLESLRPALQEAAAAAEAERAAEEEARRLMAQREAERTSVSLDTVQVGPVTVIAFEDQVELLRDVVERVWQRNLANVSGSPSLAGTSLLLQWRTPLRAVPRFEDGQVPVRDLSLNRVWTPTRDRLEERVRDALASTLSRDLVEDSPLRVWAAGAGSRTLSGYGDSEAAYRQLVVTPSNASHACVTGDLEACGVALGLELDTPRLSELLSLEARQQMVERGLSVDGRERRTYEGTFMDPDSELVRACLEEAQAEACDRALREDVVATAAAPLAGVATVDLFWYAVAVGGAGAWSRVLESASAAPMDALERISGLEGEELIGAWRASVLESRPDVHAGLGSAHWSALFWFLALAGLAMRSTRWRLA